MSPIDQHNAAVPPTGPSPSPERRGFRRLGFEVTGRIRRSDVGFTQGFEWHEGKFFESTGAIGGRSGVNVISPDGTVTNLVDHGERVFGEGLTILGDELFQLTWRDKLVLVFDLAGNLKRTMQNPRDGWGLTNDGESLIFGDGGPSFYYVDPKTFALRREVKIRHDRGEDVYGLNDLEFVNGKLYGNIYKTTIILRIDAATGRIDGVAEMNTLWHAMTDEDRAQVMAAPDNVLNGIAYDKTTGLFYVTGKRWHTIFIGRFVEKP